MGIDLSKRKQQSQSYIKNTVGNLSMPEKPNRSILFPSYNTLSFLTLRFSELSNFFKIMMWKFSYLGGFPQGYVLIFCQFLCCEKCLVFFYILIWVCKYSFAVLSVFSSGTVEISILCPFCTTSQIVCRTEFCPYKINGIRYMFQNMI